MRPVRLMIRRFLGIEEATLDFLSQLFVVVGPNGAGKSSLFEALYYALFGKGIRTERSKRELLHRAYPDEAFRVELEFDLAIDRYRVTREYSLKRGSTAALEYRGDDAWDPVCSGEQSVNSEIARLSGLDSETFRSSVFLPQGETLAFVEATPARRFRILSTLFGLDSLDRVREKAKERLERLEGTLRPALERRETLDRDNLAETLKRRQAELARLRQRSGELEQATRLAEEKVRALTVLRDTLLSLRQARVRITELSRNRREAEEKAELDRMITSALTVAAGSYPRWQKVFEALHLSGTELTERKRKQSSVHKQLEESTKAIEEGDRKDNELREHLERLTGYRDRLEREGRPLAGEIDRLAERLTMCAQEFTRLKEEEKNLTRLVERESAGRETVLGHLVIQGAKVGEAERNLALLVRIIEQGEPLQAQLNDLENECRHIHNEERVRGEELEALTKTEQALRGQLRELAGQRDALRLEKAQVEAVHREAVCRFAIQELNEKWMETGVCPLCRSQIPPPLTSNGQEPIEILHQENQYRAFQERLTGLETECAGFESQIGNARERIRDLSHQVQVIHDHRESLGRKRRETAEKLEAIFRCLLVDEPLRWAGMTERLNREREGLDRKREELHRLEKDLAAREEKLRGFQEREQEIRRRREGYNRENETLAGMERSKQRELGEVLAGMKLSREQYPDSATAFHDYWERCRKAHDEKRQEYTRIGSELARLRERHSGLEARRRELEEEIGDLEVRVARLQSEEKEKHQAFLKDLAVYGWDLAKFLDLKDRVVEGWQDRVIKLTGEIEHLESLIREGEGVLREGTVRWNVPLETLEGTLSGEESGLARLRREAGDVREQSGILSQEIETLRTRQAERDTLERMIGEVMEERETHRRLKEALEVRGFKNYLLGILLKELEKESSAFLWDLSEGRYRLKVQMSGGETDIMVLDERLGGQLRLPAECSGGEKTLIALSFSLALSRIRMRESGRGEVACLFIDEGFSPLDRDHLSLVADAILRLGRDGKMVGVVTHDPLFAALFPVHLEVGGGNMEWKENREIG
ncbi:MAG TPA: SMC family ATPase [Atribacteraceae bacterium]|nr:SMC family ATPase [Atribacteraceae bacterium]